MKDQLDKKFIKQLVAWTAKTYSYLTDNSNKDKKSKRYKRVCYKKKI